MLIYFILLITIFYCFFLSRIMIIKHTSGGGNEIFVSRSTWVLLIWLIILLVLVTFKGINVGVDYPMYYGFFVQKNYADLLEPGISYLYDLAVKFDNFYVFSVSVYSLFLLFMFYGIKKNTPNYMISILLFVIMHIYYNAFNQIRQLLAVSIIFCFIHFLTSGKRIDKIKYVFVLLFALWFHNSAIFLFVLFLIPKKKYSSKLIIPLFLITIVVYFIPGFKNQVGEFMIAISGSYGEKYSSGYNFFGVNKEKGLLQLIPVIVQMIFVVVSLYIPKFNKKLNLNEKLYIFSTNAVIINLCLYALAGVEAVDRLQIYFSSFNIYFYAYLIHLLVNKKKILEQFFVFLIIAFWILYYTLRLSINVHGIVPYNFLI